MFVPALFTRISSFERELTIELIFFESVISQTKDLLSPLVFFIILLNLSKSFSVLLMIITVAPASAKAIAHALPIPFPAPVTKAILFFKLIYFNIF